MIPPFEREEQHINSRPLAGLSVKAKSGGREQLVPTRPHLLSIHQKGIPNQLRCWRCKFFRICFLKDLIAVQWRHWHLVSNSTLIPISETRSNFNRDTNARRDDPWLGTKWARAPRKENHARNILRISTLDISTECKPDIKWISTNYPLNF